MNTTLLALTTTLLAAIPAVASAAPAWCGNATFNGYDLSDLSSTDATRVMLTLTMATCSPNREAQAQLADIDRARASWGKRLGMIDADWADMIPYSQLGQADRYDVTWESSSKSLAELTALDQYKAIRGTFHLPGQPPMADSRYVADALESTLTEAGRLAAIESCMNAPGHEPADNAVAWAVCEGDIKRFDADKLATQLRADTAHGGEARMYLRFRYYELAPKLKQHAASVAVTLKADPAYKKLFELAEQGRTEWTTGIGKHTELLALATQLDSATFFQSRSPREGCEAKTTEAMRAAVATLPASAFANMGDLREDPYKGFGAEARPVIGANPLVQLAAIPYIECQPDDGLAAFLSVAISDYAGQRGPRSAALDKVMSSPVELDDANAKLIYPPLVAGPYALSGGSLSSWGGVIRTVTADGDSTKIEFEHQLVKVEVCTKAHDTTKLERIDSSGQFIYQSVCDHNEMETEDLSPRPVTIDAQFATVLKAGMRISVTNSEHHGGQGRSRGAHGSRNHEQAEAGHSMQDVLAVWPSKTAKTPTIVLGAALK